jgi:uncharacterized protein
MPPAPLPSTPETIREVLTATRTWAVVGCSPDPSRDSHRIARLLQERGYRVIPVNPTAERILDERCYPSVPAIPAAEGVEVVDVFRRADQAGAHVDEAIAVGARAVWLQRGVIRRGGRPTGAGGRPARRHGPLPGDRVAAAGGVAAQLSPGRRRGRVTDDALRRA